MIRLSVSERARIIAALVEGNPLRSTSRLCGVAFHTVLKLFPEIGTACANFHDANVRRIPSMRRFTRLTNAFSKKIENHADAVALHFMHYDFCRVHKTLRVTPANEAGISDHVWGIDELAALLENAPKSQAA
jgi:hypothetical protein